MPNNPTRTTPTKLISAQVVPIRTYANPATMIQDLWAYRELIGQFTKREVLERYKGSYLGLIWSFLTPIALLLVYTFVFSIVLRIRWAGNVTDSHAETALTLFTGLIAFSVFAEATQKAPQLITDNENYVKKVVFPLEILSISTLGSSLIHSLFSLFILLLGVLFITQSIPWTIIFLPLMYLPLLLLSLSSSWFFASIGVFVRDIGHLLTVVITTLNFLTPIFYPASAIPENVRFIIYLNPLTFIVNHFRRVVLWGQMPDWGEFTIFTLCSFVICLGAYVWFMKSKRIFADLV